GLVGEDLSDLPLALAHASLLAVPEAEARNVDEGDRDAQGILALAGEELAVLHVAAEVLFDLAADDLLEAAVVLVDPQAHGSIVARTPRLRPPARLPGSERWSADVTVVFNPVTCLPR